MKLNLNHLRPGPSARGGSPLCRLNFQLFWVPLLTLLLLSPAMLRAQSSQFAFDANGNLLIQSSENFALPQIVSQPQPQVVMPGSLGSFLVVAANTHGLSYQWRFNGTNYPGATADALLITNVTAANEGLYAVVLSNSSGSVTSAPAALMIDSDGDGLPDSWELAHFGDLSQTTTGDFDGDGVSNLQEFLDGTDPANATSVRYRLTILQDGGVIQTTPSQASYTNGQSVTITVTAQPSETFYAWTGDILSRSNTITLVMTTNRTEFAHFNPLNFNWINNAGGDWFVAANWLPNLVPGTNDNVTIITSATITLNSDAECGAFIFGATGIPPTLDGSGKLTVHGSATWAAGSMTGSGRTVLDTTSTMLISNPATIFLTQRTLENGGTVYWTGTGDIDGSVGAVITNRPGALFTVQNSANFVAFPGMSPRLDNAGIFRKSVSAGNTIFGTFYGYPFNNYGTVDIQSGVLYFNSGGYNTGDIHVAAGTALLLANYGSGPASSITGAGDFVAGGNSDTLDGLFNITGTWSIYSAANFIGTVYCTNNILNLPVGTASFNGTGTVVPTLINLNGGTLDGSMRVTVGGAMNWTAGSMTGTGRTIIPPGVILGITNPAAIYMDHRTLENGGTIYCTGTGDIDGSAGAVITNRPGALFSVQNSANFVGSPGTSPRLDNAGTFRKSVSTGTTTFGPFYPFIFNNYGTVDIQTGLLTLNSGYNVGDMHVPAGTALLLANFGSGSASTITGAGDFIGGGNGDTLDGLFNITGTWSIYSPVNFIGTVYCTNNTLNLLAGTASFNGTGTVAPAFINLNGGTLDGAMTVTVVGSMNWTAGSMTGLGRTIIPPGVILGITNPATIFLNQRTLENGGTIFWTGAGDFDASAGAVITNRPGALFNVQNAANFVAFPGTSPRLDNAGTFRKSVSNGNTIFGTFYGFIFNNYGSVDIQTGVLYLNSGGYNAGSIHEAAGTALLLANFGSGSASNVTGAGDFVVSGNGNTLDGLFNVTGTWSIYSQVNFIGTVFCTNNILNFAAGTASFNGTGLVAPAILNLIGGTLDGTMPVTAVNGMTWTSGGMSGVGGRTLIGPSATGTIANSSIIEIDQRTFENAGTVTWTGTGNFVLSQGAVFTNRPGALFNVQNATSFNGSPGIGARIDNAGIFRKSLNPGTTSLGFTYTIPFFNYGTVDVQSGALAANGGYYFSPAAVLKCTVWGTVPGATYGQLQVPGAVSLDGTLSVSLTNHYIPATNDTFAVVSCGTRLGAFTNFLYPSNAVSMTLSNAPSAAIVRATGVSLQPTPLSPAPGLISWWRAENNALDTIGTNNGVLTNGTTFAAGKVGQGFLFDGINDYVVVPDSASLRPASVTLEAWVKIASSSGIMLVFAKPIGSGTLDSYGLAIQDGVPLGAISDANGFGPFLYSTYPMATNQWYHLAYSLDGNTLQEVLYVNGATVAAANAGRSIGYDAHPMLIGADIENGVPSFSINGQIDEATIYNRALDANEIASIYNVGAAGKQLPSVSQPLLRIEEITPTGVRLSWSASSPNYHLVYSTNLATTNWTTSALTPVITGTNYVITNSLLQSAQQFYRLSNP